ncbi:MAG: TMEM175 family protein [Thermoanaerobaculales bacterium]|nr:TMEM175 family protein [Thermoanaerobaculales bacterium]
MPESPQTGTARRQLERLGTLTDVVYGVALVLIIQWLPLPEESHSGGIVWLLDLWAEYAGNIVSVIIGLVFTIIYWLRSNTLMAALDRTDGVHTGLSIASLFFFLLLVYVVRVSAEVAAPSRRAGESVAVALIGIAAGAAWWWARRKGLVREGVSKDEMLGIQLEAFTEPLTALVTLPFAYVGEIAWNLAWFAYIPIAAFLRRRGTVPKNVA